MSARRFLFAASALLLALFAGVNLLAQSGLANARLDLTEGRLYTLSKGSAETLKGLTDPIELTFVYTASVGQDYPAVRAYAVRVRELLTAYNSVAGPRLRLREIDPLPFSKAEDEALASGLVAVETNGPDPLYFGLIGRNSVDDERVIPFLAPEHENTLEYDLTRMIARLDQPEPARIGLLTTVPGMSSLSEESGYSILREMRKTFTVELIDPGFAELPPEMDVLMLAHPPVLTDWQQWQIDQFILRNGRALFLIDPAAKTAQGGGPFGMTDRQIRSDLGRFASVWGVALDQAAIADTQTALSIEISPGEGRNTVLRHPLFLSVPPGLMSADNVVTADLDRPINMGAPGRLNIAEQALGEVEVLMSTGPAPSPIPAGEAAIDLSPSETLDLYTPSDTPAVLALRLTGALVTAFPEGAPRPVETGDPLRDDLALSAAAEAGPAIMTSQADADIVIVADVDLLDDGLHSDLQTGIAFADNLTFVLNALDSLAGGSDLMELRARAPGLRRMVRVDKMREAAQAEYFSEQARLENRLSQSQARLEELQAIGATGGFFDQDVSSELTASEREELDRLRGEIVDTRESLRQIERDFRKEIDRLEFWLRMFTILFGPLLVAFAGLGVWFKLNRARQA